jgi:membrane protein
MMVRSGRWSRTLRQLGIQIVRDDVVGLSAELAYRFFLSIFPFFIFLTSLGTLVASAFGLPDPAQHFADLLSQVMPPDAAEVFEAEIQRVIGTTRVGVASLSLAGALLVATSGTNALMKAMNRAYSVEETRPFWNKYLRAFALTALAGMAVIAAFLLFVKSWSVGFGVADAAGQGGRFIDLVEYVYWPAVAALISAAVSVLYWAAPNVRNSYRLATPGALLFTLSWMLTTAIFARYVEHFGSYGITYGTLAGVAVLLIWFYLTAFLLITGVELNVVIEEYRDPARFESQRRETREKAAVRQLPPRAAGTFVDNRDAA